MLAFKVLIFEFLPVDRLPSCAITSSEVPSLDHEPFDDSVEAGSCILLNTQK